MGSSPSTPDSPRLVRFGVFEVDLEGGELRKSGLKIGLQEQPFRVLRLLLESAGKVVSREEIQQQLWPADTFVEFDRSLNTAINKIRDALGDSAASPRYIETVPRRGYRFLASVQHEDGTGSKQLLRLSPDRERSHANKFSFWLAAFAGALGTAMAVIAWTHLHHAAPVRDAPVRKFNLSFEGLTLNSAPSISPDARHIAFIAENLSAATRRLHVYDFDLGETREIANTEGASHPFWSTASEFIGFAASGELRKVPVAGGVPIVLCQFAPDSGFDKGTWSPDGDSIVFSAGPPWRLYEVLAVGGRPKPFAEPSRHKVMKLLAPHFFPNGASGPSLLFVSSAVDDETREGRLVVRNLGSGREQVLELGLFPVYSPEGHIIYQTDFNKGGISALPFSLATLRPTGAAFPIANVARTPDVANDGTLVSLDGGKADQYRLAWLDRNGKKLGDIGQSQADIMLPTLSPDGRFAGVEGWEATTGADLWLHDVAQSTKIRLTRTYPTEESRTVWSPDGKQIAFWSDVSGNADLYIMNADGSGEPRPVLTSPKHEWPEDWSTDGNYIIVTIEETNVNRCDIWYLKRIPDGNFRLIPFLASPKIYRDAAKLSPDGHFLAYVSDESGRMEVWVSRFPQGGRKWQVTRSGGTQPRWSRSGKELFYVQGDTLFTVDVSTKLTFTVGSPERLFTYAGLAWRFLHPTYDVSADSKKFVVIAPVGSIPPLTIRVVQNWFAEFQDRRRKN